MIEVNTQWMRGGGVVSFSANYNRSFHYPLGLVHPSGHTHLVKHTNYSFDNVTFASNLPCFTR